MRARRRCRDRPGRRRARRSATASSVGVGDEARDRGRRPRRGRGGDRRPRRARRPARLDRPPSARPRIRACRSRATTTDRPARARGGSTRTAGSTCLRRSSRSARRCRSPSTSRRSGASSSRAGRPPASARRSSTLLTVARELLDPKRLARETLEEAVTVQFPGLVGVLPGFGRMEPNDWGLGFELQGREGAALDGRAQLAAHVRPLRPQRDVPLGRSGARARARVPYRPRLRRLGEGRVAAPRRRRAGGVGVAG